MRTIAILFIIYTSIASAFAQGSDFSFSLGGGVNVVHSDIDGDNAFHGALGVSYRLHDAFDVELNGIVGSLQGEESAGGNRYSFSNNTSQILLRGNVYLLSLLSGKGDKIDFFATAGAGLLLSNVTDITTPANDPWGEAYSGSDIIVPVGAGIMLPFSSSIALRVQFLYNLAFFDEMDGYNPQVAANQANDQFTNVGIGIVFRPGKGTSSPEPEPAVVEEDVIIDDDLNEEPSNEEEPVEETKEEEVAEEEPADEEPEEQMPAEEQEEEPTQEEPSNDTDEEPAEQNEEGQTDEDGVSVFQDPVFNLNGSRANSRYYVIGASFKTMSQAQEYQFNMASLGYATLIITDYEKKRYRISFGAYMDLAAAKEQASKLQKDHDPDTWIIENAVPGQ